MPLARERHGDGQPFLLYPHHAILPSFGFPGRKKILTLGWDPHHARLHAFTHRGAPTIAARKNTTSEASNNKPAAASLQPLPPSTAYLLRLVCRGVGVAGKRVLCQLKVSAGGGAVSCLYLSLFFAIHKLQVRVKYPSVSLASLKRTSIKDCIAGACDVMYSLEFSLVNVQHKCSCFRVFIDIFSSHHFAIRCVLRGGH